MPTTNWQRRAVRRLSKTEITKLASPPIEIENKPPPVKIVLAYALKQKEMRMQDMYSYMVKIQKEIPEYHCAERTCREALSELRTAGKVKQRFCECGQATFYSWIK